VGNVIGQITDRSTRLRIFTIYHFKDNEKTNNFLFFSINMSKISKFSILGISGGVKLTKDEKERRKKRGVRSFVVSSSVMGGFCFLTDGWKIAGFYFLYAHCVAGTVSAIQTAFTIAD
jgi:hypothetical protein